MFFFAIAHRMSVPTTARNVYVRAKRHSIDEALWNMGIVRAEPHLKSVLGIGG